MNKPQSAEWKRGYRFAYSEDGTIRGEWERYSEEYLVGYLAGKKLVKAELLATGNRYDFAGGER